MNAKNTHWVPLGKGKGSIAVEEADDDQLTRFVAYFDEDPQKRAKFAEAAEAARAELKVRSEPPPEPDVGTAIALAHDPGAITARFDKLRENYHLVSPATQIDALPIGFGVSVSFVSADPNAAKSGPGDVYKTGSRDDSKVGISAHVIQQIAAAAAVDWDPRLSGRLDDGSDPRYVHYRAVGWVRNFDGTPRKIQGEVEMDMRDDSPQVEEIKAKAKRRKEGYNDGGASQILELRKFILRHAETKAQNRAVCKGLGVKRAYHAKELQKPFAIAKLTFTGHTEDPELRKTFAIMNAQAALRGSSALYGEEPLAALPPAVTPALGHAPPPLGVTEAELADDEEPEYEPDDMPDNGEEGGLGQDVDGSPPGED